MTGEIEQPWNDDRLKMSGVFIGCVTKENADHVMRMQDELARTRAENVRLRYLLARQHDGQKHMIYGDDGELQCGACFIDFRRDAVPDIEKKLHDSGMRELQRMIDAGEWPIKAAANAPPY